MRTCGCGCGQTLRGVASQRFVNDAHRKRAVRRRAEPGQEPGQVPDNPDTEPGRARAGLEQWLADASDLPPSLVELTRLLADQVDADPSRSPMMGRYTVAVQALHEVAEVVDPDNARIIWGLRAGCDVPAHAASGGSLLHCAICCEEPNPNGNSVGRWLYGADGQPTLWVPSDATLLEAAQRGEEIVLS